MKFSTYRFFFYSITVLVINKEGIFLFVVFMEISTRATFCSSSDKLTSVLDVFENSVH